MKSKGQHGRERATGRWTPGVSGNPAGRPRVGHALAEAIRRQADPRELVEIALKIARSSKSEAYRLQALAWLRDSGYQRPAAQHEVVAVAATHLDAERLLAQLSDAALRELATAHDALALESGTNESGDE